ncbi:MAG: TonB-dependent receptor [Alphaproteobacteria bacterium]|nr:TonB-dependent receptor [Alphaproteobacteria bacterium]
MNPATSRIASLMGTASIITLISALSSHAQEVAQAQMAQAAPEAVPEQVLITGSLIHGTAAVGVPVTNLGTQDFTETGNTTIGDLFRTVPEANVAPGPSAVNSGGHQERETRVNIRGLDQTGPRTLLMIDGVRFPPQADGLCAIDPSIIPALALDRVDILADGASATYGSDAIAGVINIILKRGFDGAVTLVHYEQPDIGGQEIQASQLWGRTWDGGDITLTYEFLNQNKVRGHSNFTMNYTPWGLDNEIPIGSSLPGTISTGAPNVNNGAGVSGVGTNCSNCFAVPHGAGANFNSNLNNGVGPLAPGQVPVLNFPSLSAGVNEIDPLKTGWELAAQQKNSFVATLDQRLFPGVTFFASGFDTHRYVNELLPSFYSQGVNQDIRIYAVPTTNPYYPTGAPNNLRVAYNMSREIPPFLPAFETSYRYQVGLNLDLPFGWSGQVYYTRNYEQDQYIGHTVNPNSASAALGWAVNGGITKPASVPYLNLFCDPTAFKCNAPATLAYITGQRILGDIYQITERGGRFDGPLFDIPGGQVKAAVGGLYESDGVVAYSGNNTGSPPGTPFSELIDSEPYNVWAGFVQVDIPVFGDNFNIPLVRRLDLEGSWRYDSYSGSLSGNTKNPKVAFTWLVDEFVGLTVRGSWGTSFRFANAGEYSTVASDANGDFNFPGQSSVIIPCSGNPAGGAASALAAAGVCTGGINPTGITWGGGPHPELRNYTNAAGQAASREGGVNLAPETSNNYSVGAEIAPQFELLRGFDLQATWYSVKINGTLLGFNATNTQTLTDPAQRFHIILPSDLGCPAADNATPALCAPFEKMAAAALLDRNSAEDISQLTNIYWIDDGSTVGTGFLHVSGVDFNSSYTIDLGDYGAWNTGITGTYYLHRFSQTVPGSPVIDGYHQNIARVGGIAQNGVATGPRLIYRARLGWSDGPYTITGFVNYQAHYFETRVGTPPNVNFQCVTSGGTVGGGTFPCAISNFSDIEPAFVTFDLSLGFNTGDLPANDYLKRITIQLTAQNLLNKHSAFEYGPVTSARNASAYAVLSPNTGRTLGIALVKTW